MRDPAVTRKIMSAIRSRGGKADQALGRALWHRGLRYRRRSNLVGKPDLVFATPKLVVFVDGDFWHGRGLDDRIARGDFKRNADYWVPKLRRNIQRDAEVTKTLQEQEWRVIRVWESDIQRDLEGVAEMIATEVRSRRPDRQ